MRASPRTTSSERATARAGGFTLLELLTVIAVIGVIAGVSIGYLGRSDPRRVADSIIGGEVRSAQLTARAEGVPTEVLLRPGRDNEPASVQARLLQPVVTFHLEPNDPVLDDVYRATIDGDDVPAGRFGHARRAPEQGKGSLLRWAVTPTVLDLRDGFVVRLDLLLERRAAATVLRLPPTLEVVLDADARPRARLRLRGGGESSTLAAVTTDVALPVGRWCTLEAGCDGHVAWLALDGRRIGETVADGTPHQERDSSFDVSPADGALPGLVDEVRWFSYVFSPAQLLPVELPLDRTFRFAFDSHGEATESPVVEFAASQGGS